MNGYRMEHIGEANASIFVEQVIFEEAVEG